MPNFFVVATPIGNLQDISQRAIKILKEVDLILAENPRITLKLLSYYQIKKPILRYHQHSKLKRVNQILNFLREGKNLALVSDAGTPGISDPGNKLIQKIIEYFGEEVKIIPIPGPSALICAASISGFWMDKFLFLGFPPKKKKRKKFFEKVISSEYPVIFFESPWRIIKSLEDLESLDNQLEVVVTKELTKKFEKIYRGKIGQVKEKIKNDKIKGEFVVIVKR